MERHEFTALYEQLRGPIYSFAAARLSAHSALDVVHDTFEVVWAKRDQAPSEGDQRAAWCFGIARNKILQEGQRLQRKHHDNRFLEDFGQIDPLQDDVANTVLASIAGRSVWQSLSEEDRRLLLLLASSELSGAEMAAMLDISHVAYRRRVSRLRERIAAEQRSVEARTSVEGGGVR